MSEFDQSMEAPTEPPQFDQEEDLQKSFQDLMDETPGWAANPSFWAEFAHLYVQHASVRAAIGYATEISAEHMRNLRNCDESSEMYRAQGAIRGVEQFYVGIFNAMTAASTPNEDTDNADE